MPNNESRGRALCPFCGSPYVQYDKHSHRWGCDNGHSFPIPSYGTGRGRAGLGGSKGYPSATKAINIGHPVSFILRSIVLAGVVIGIISLIVFTCQNKEQTSAQIEQLVFQSINEVRAEHGLGELIWDESLADIARSHNEDMIKNDFCGHQRSPNYPNLSFDMGENCYCNVQYMPPLDSPAKVAAYAVDGWMKSSGHAANILKADYKATGIGVAFNDSGNCYITQVFLQ